jgi:3-oxoadipate enol-lactonase
VIGLLDALAIPRAHFCGISMGGMTGQWLALHHPQRFGKIAIANTAARIGSAEGWQTRAELVRREGMGAVADGAAARWFTPAFSEHHAATVAAMISSLRASAPEGYASCCDALAAADLREDIGAIALPLLVIAGEHDPVTTVDDASVIVLRVPGARLERLPASHLSNIEAPARFTQALLTFLTS